MFARVTAVALALAVPSIALACDESKKMAAKKAEVSELTVAQLVDLRKAAQPTVLDANGEQTRARFGVIPGATLLSSVKYAASELPAQKDAKLVFYCANTKCGAAKMAAQKALTEGYSDVAILPVGIAGWKEAGQPTSALPRS